MRAFLILFSFTLLVCCKPRVKSVPPVKPVSSNDSKTKVTQAPRDTPSIDALHFGDRGGFTGKERLYKLEKTGALFYGEKKIATISAETCASLFEEAERAKTQAVDKKLQPANINSFVEFASGEDITHFEWPNGSALADPKLVALHKNLMAVIPKN